MMNFSFYFSAERNFGHFDFTVMIGLCPFFLLVAAVGVYAQSDILLWCIMQQGN